MWGSQAIRDGVYRIDRHGRTCINTSSHRVRANGFNSVHGTAGKLLFNGCGHPRYQPAATDRDNNCFNRRQIFGQLESDGRSPESCVNSFKRVDVESFILTLDFLGTGKPTLSVGRKLDLCTLSATAVYSSSISGLEHHHARRCAEFTCGVRDRDRMVASADGSDSAPDGFVISVEDVHQCAPDFEGTSALKEFKLEE